MIDGTVVIEATGAHILAALENGVSKWPALEGRFPQVLYDGRFVPVLSSRLPTPHAGPHQGCSFIDDDVVR